jgi:hypothetical protein
MILILTKYHLDDEIKEYKMADTCDTKMGKKKIVQHFDVELERIIWRIYE